MTLYEQNKDYLDTFDALIAEIDAIQSRPFRHWYRPRAAVPARSTVDAWIDQFVALLVVRS